MARAKLSDFSVTPQSPSSLVDIDTLTAAAALRETQHSLTMVFAYTATTAAMRRFFLYDLLLLRVLSAESVFVSSQQSLSSLIPTRGTGINGEDELFSTLRRMTKQEDFKQIRKELNRDFLSIAAPAFLQQAAVPFADLVDSTFVAKLEPEALGGVGVARASQVCHSETLSVCMYM